MLYNTTISSIDSDIECVVFNIAIITLYTVLHVRRIRERTISISYLEREEKERERERRREREGEREKERERGEREKERERRREREGEREKERERERERGDELLLNSVYIKSLLLVYMYLCIQLTFAFTRTTASSTNNGTS